MTSATVTVEFYNGSSWVDISADVVGSFKHGHGITSQGPVDRVATTGTFEFDMNNSTTNAGGLNGYYSPGHANVRAGWAIGAKVRVKKVYSTNTRYDLYRIKDIEPTPGEKGARTVAVTAVDYMDEFEIRKISELSVQVDKRGDELLTTLVSSMPIAPTATSYDTGLYLLPYAFHDEQDEDTFAITVLQKIAQSDMSYIYVDGDSTGGETLIYEQPQKRYTNTTSLATFSNTMIELDTTQARDNIYNKVRVTVNPVEVGTDVNEVVAKSENVIDMEPNAQKTVTLRYIDQTTTRRISAKDILTPVVGTDYIFSKRRKSLQGEYNASLTVTFSIGSNSVSAQLENTIGYKGYVTKMQARGTKLTMYNKVESIAEDATSIAEYGERTITYNMPYQQNENLGSAVADELLRRHKDPTTQANGMRFAANRNTTFMGYALTLGIGDRITISETMTGINTDYYINSIEHEYKNKILFVSYGLEKAYGETGVTYFKFGTNTFGDSSILIPL